MSRPSSEKCRLCSKLSAAQAQQLHGAAGDGCWEAKRCHDRRSYYRHRGVKNHNRKTKRHQQRQANGLIEPGFPHLPLDSSRQQQSGRDLALRAAQPVVTLSIPAPAVPAAIAHFYRQTKDAPLHALGAELWLGNDRTAKIEPVHCLGLTELQVKQLLVHILDSFAKHCGMKVERFRSSVELDPLNCPISPCPLHPDELK